MSGRAGGGDLPELAPDDKAQRVLSAALGRDDHRVTPVWCHRQAGRYLPEFVEYCKGTDFFHNCGTPERAAAITLQPLRMNIDAVIIFSDILIIPQALTMEVRMIPGKGPDFPQPLSAVGDLSPMLGPLTDSLAGEMGGRERAAARVAASMELRHAPAEQVGAACAARLAYVGRTVGRVRRELAGRVPVIGFCGAPWTLMCYMTVGQSSSNYTATRRWLYQSPAESHQLLALLTCVAVELLLMQIDAGAQMVQVFESSGAELTPENFRDFELPCLQLIASTIRRLRPGVPVMLFARGCSHSLDAVFAETAFHGVSIDCHTSLSAARRLGARHGKAVQGNLDPCALYGTPASIRAAARRMLDEAAAAGGVNRHGVPRSFVANLGWGMLPSHDPDHLRAYVDAVHEYTADGGGAPCGGRRRGACAALAVAAGATAAAVVARARRGGS